MKKLSENTKIPQSGIRRMFDLAKTKDNITSFVIGEPDFDTPKHIKEAAAKALFAGQTHYTDNAGILSLREAIIKEVEAYDKVSYSTDEIVVCTGGMQALYLSMVALLDPGDEVIISDPSYANYTAQIKMNHGVPVPVAVKEEEGFNFTYENLSKAVTKKTKAILLNSPCNPTGAVAGEKVMRDIARVAIENDLYVIYDAVYKYLLYDGFEYVNIASIEGMRERTIYIDSFSKTYAMTGWRIGYLAGPREIVSLLPKLQENIPSCVSTFTQYAGIEAIDNGKGDISEMNEEYVRRRNTLLGYIDTIDKLSCIVPKGAFYAFINIKKTGLSSQEFAEQLLEKQNVVVAPGSAFGKEGEGYIRISYATSVDNITKGMEKLKAFIEDLS